MILSHFLSFCSEKDQEKSTFDWFAMPYGKLFYETKLNFFGANNLKNRR